jgi:hypothetical protein
LGKTLLVTVSDCSAGVWAIGIEPCGPLVPFRNSAVRAWHDAAAAISRSLVALWDVPSEVTLPEGAVRLDVLARAGLTGRPEQALDGDSFGLSFFLAIASVCLGVPVKPSVAASAAIDPEGNLHPVDPDTLADKVLAIAELAPSVTTFIVHHDQRATAANAIRSLGLSHLAVRGARRAEETLPHAVTRSPRALLSAAGRAQETRVRVVEKLFQLTVTGRKTVTRWTPVEETCRFALVKWKTVSRRERWYLRFVEAVAARHERNAGRIPAFDKRHLSGRSAAERLSIVANYVQHSTDTGRPAPREVLRMARAYLPKPRDAHAPHAKVMGSLGRLCAVTGRPREAVTWQKKAVSVLFASNAHVTASHQFAEWYRLAGALGSDTEFQAADAMLQGAMIGRFEPTGEAYVQLGRCQALVALGRQGEAIDGLRRLCADGRVPSNPASSAARWLVLAFDQCGDVAAANAFLASAPLREFKHQILVDLDRAVRARNLRVAAQALRRLTQADPGPMHHLLAVAPRDTMKKARFVQRFFPY